MSNGLAYGWHQVMGMMIEDSFDLLKELNFNQLGYQKAFTKHLQALVHDPVVRSEYPALVPWCGNIYAHIQKFGNSNMHWVSFSLDAIITETPKIQLDEQTQPCRWLSAFINLKNGRNTKRMLTGGIFIESNAEFHKSKQNEMKMTF